MRKDKPGELSAEKKQAILAAIVDSSDDVIFSKTLDGFITTWNKAAEKMFGYTEAEAIGRNNSFIIPESRLKEEEEIIAQIMSGNKIDHFETVRVNKSGEQIPISLSISPITDQDGKVIGVSKIARDISERIVLQEKQALLAAIVSTSEDAIVSKTLEGTIMSWNYGAEKIFGYTEQEAIGKHITMLIPPERLKEEDYIIGEIKKGNRIQHFETYRVTKSGKQIPISLSISPVKNNKGAIIGASKIARDISKEVQMKEESKRYLERLEIINSIIQSISADLDLNKVLQKVTDATTRFTGAQFGAFFYNKVDERGESYMLFTLSGAPKEAFEHFGMPRNTAVFHPTFSGQGVVRVDDITKDPKYGKNDPHFGIPKGHLPVVSYLAVPVISRSGSVLGGLFFGHGKAGVFTAEHEDIVVSIAAQAAIAIDNAKLYQEIKQLNEKKDEFIGLASHELKTPLSTIMGYVQILSRIEKDKRSQMFIDKTLQQIRKLTSLVNDLLDVSKIEAGKLQLTKTDFDIKTVTNDAIELVQHSAGSHTITLHSNIESLMIHADPQRIEQVILNLLTNAVKYSPEANKVEVYLDSYDNQLKVGVKDYGFGIPAEKFDKLFSRFYRVEEGNSNISGLGMGLYLSQEIIQRHKGKIWVESKVGQGSTFWFTIPINETGEQALRETAGS